jgi:hypothetical protein
VTDEGVAETVKWVEEKGAKYAYGYDKGGKLASYFKVSGIPAAVLVDAKGIVLWQGHPASLSEALIEKAVAGALPKPQWEWAPSTKAVKAALLKRQYKAALDECAKLTEADSGPAIAQAIRTIVESRVAGLKSTYASGDYFGTETAAAALAKELAGLPEKDAVVAVQAELDANKDAPAIIKAQKQIAKLRAAELSKRKEQDAAMEDLAKISKAQAGNFAGKQADEFLSELKERRRNER